MFHTRVTINKLIETPFAAHLAVAQLQERQVFSSNWRIKFHAAS